MNPDEAPSPREPSNPPAEGEPGKTPELTVVPDPETLSRALRDDLAGTRDHWAWFTEMQGKLRCLAIALVILAAMALVFLLMLQGIVSSMTAE